MPPCKKTKLEPKNSKHRFLTNTDRSKNVIPLLNKICAGDIKYLPVLYLEVYHRDNRHPGGIHWRFISDYMSGDKSGGGSRGYDFIAMLCEYLYPYTPTEFQRSDGDTKRAIELLRAYRFIAGKPDETYRFSDARMLEDVEAEFALNPFYWTIRAQAEHISSGLLANRGELMIMKATAAHLSGNLTMKKEIMNICDSQSRKKIKNIFQVLPCMCLCCILDRERNRTESKQLILCARRFCQETHVHEDYLPLDIFKILIALAELLPPSRFF